MAKPIIPEIDRFWSKVRKTDDCWVWIGSVTANGYGRFQVGYGRPPSSHVDWAHRYSYQTFVGPIPDGLQIDHLCRNRRCVRPDHLEAVTMQENLRRGLGNQYRGQRACSRGHRYTPETIRWWGPDRKWRTCRICERKRQNGVLDALPKPSHQAAAGVRDSEATG